MTHIPRIISIPGKDVEAAEAVAKVSEAYNRAVTLHPTELQAYANMATFYLNINRCVPGYACRCTIWKIV